MSGYLKEGIIYPHPLTAEQRLLIEVVTTRYRGISAPFVAFDRGDHTELRCPENLRRVVPWEKEASV